jgi:hypothetical protein
LDCGKSLSEFLGLFFNFRSCLHFAPPWISVVAFIAFVGAGETPALREPGAFALVGEIAVR